MYRIAIHGRCKFSLSSNGNISGKLYWKCQKTLISEIIEEKGEIKRLILFLKE